MQPDMHTNDMVFAKNEARPITVMMAQHIVHPMRLNRY